MSQPTTAYKVLTADQMAALEQEGVFAGARWTRPMAISTSPPPPS